MLPSKNAIELSRLLFAKISPGAGMMLAALILDPEISINPYFWTILLGGSVVLTLSLYSLLRRKYGWLTGIWQVVGVSVAGFVLVSWAMYDSFPMGVMMQTIVAVLILFAGVISRRKIRRIYRKQRRLVYLALLLCALVPLTAIIPRVGATPVLIVSPSDRFVTLARGGMTRDITVTIVSVYSSVWDIGLTARSSDLLAVYLDGRESGPLEIPFLDRGRQLDKTLRIESSPLIMNGTYDVGLDFTYRDAFENLHAGSTSLQVIVGGQVAPQCIIATATFGSEVTPEVALLRDFRDRLVLHTTAGSAFVKVFNSWYYSFSPAVARVIAENEPLRALARVMLYPLLGILILSAFTFSMFSWVPEFGVVIAGIVASSLIGLLYASLPIFLAVKIVVRKRRIRLVVPAKSSMISIVVALTLLGAGELTRSSFLIGLGGSLTVLASLITAPVIAVFAILALRS